MFEPGQTTPSRFLTDSRASGFDFITLDSEGNLYASVEKGSTTSIFEWRKGRGKAHDLGFSFDYAAGLRLTAAGDIALCTTTDLVHYQCGKVTNHSRTFTPYFSSGGYQISFGPGETQLFVSDSSVDEWNWPGAQSQWSNVFQLPTLGYGVAVYPPDPFGAPYSPE